MKYTVKIEDREYEVQIDDLQTRPIKARINGETIDVWPEETTQSATSPSVAPQQPSTKKPAAPVPQIVSKQQISVRNAVNAPIPGVIIHIAVTAGEKVAFGQDLCTLEAMKMKNAIRSGQPGIIDKVLVSVGDQVSQNQPLMTYRNEEV